MVVVMAERDARTMLSDFPVPLFQSAIAPSEENRVVSQFSTGVFYFHRLHSLKHV